MSSNRTIKFRVWDVENSKYMEDSVMWSVVGVPVHLMPGQPPYIPFITFALTSPSDKYLVEQFTGLLDKNGKEIYEGDVLRFTYPEENNTAIVRWTKEGEDNYPGFVINNSLTQSGPAEVIGNINQKN